MKAIKTLLIFLSISLVRITLADEIQISTSTTTNSVAKVWTRVDVFMRNGQRILEIKTTSNTEGRGWFCQQNVFWQGQVAVEVMSSSFDESVSIEFHAVPQIDVVAELNKQGGIRKIVLWETNHEVRSAFTLIAGRLEPVSDEEIQRSNASLKDITSMCSRFARQESSADEFMGDVDRLIKTYGKTNEHHYKSDDSCYEEKGQVEKKRGSSNNE